MKIPFVKKTLTWLSGADPHTLELSDKATQWRYHKLGATLFIPFVTGFAGMYFAAPYIGLTEGVPRLIASFLWAFVILILDAALIATIQRPENVGSGWWDKTKTYGLYVASALLRLAYATIAAIVIAHPIVMKVLEGDINREITEIRNEQDSLKRYSFNRQKDTAVAQFVYRLDSISHLIQCKNAAYSMEVSTTVKGAAYPCNDGYASGSPRHGFRADSIQKEKARLVLAAQYVQKQIDSTTADFQERLAAQLIQLHNVSGSDYIERVTALERLKRKNAVIGFVRVEQVEFYLMLFLLMLDTLAVFCKFLIARGLYDDIHGMIKDRLKWSAGSFYNNLSGKYAHAYKEDLSFSNRKITQIYNTAGNTPPEEIRKRVEGYLKHPIRMLENEWKTIRQVTDDDSPVKAATIKGVNLTGVTLVLLCLLYIGYDVLGIPFNNGSITNTLLLSVISNFVFESIKKYLSSYE